MRITTHKRQELYISIIVTGIFFLSTLVSIAFYLHTIASFTKPSPHISGEFSKVQGIHDESHDTIQILSVTPTASPSATPTPKLKAIPVTKVPSIHQQILQALNTYRASRGIPPLVFDSTLQTFAQSRADQFISAGDMDSHAGFQNMLQDDGFNKMGFDILGENSSYGEWGSPQNLIESIYASSPAHNESQLRTDWTHVGIGVSGHATNLVFGGKKR